MKELKVSDKELNEYLALVGQQESNQIVNFSAMDGRLEDFMENYVALNGDKLPWSCTHQDVALGKGQLSIWGGINGHGKTLMLTQVMASLLYKRRILIASMEMKAEETIKWMATQSAGCEPGKQYVMNFLKEYGDNGFVYDSLDRTPKNRMLGLAHYAGSELAVDHMVIDSLAMCGVGRDDYAGQHEFIDSLRGAAKRHNFHIHLVCHMRKGESEDSKVGKFEIRGAAEITDLADKLFIVQRNKKKERAVRRQASGIELRDDEVKVLDQPDSFLSLVKNRQDGEEAVYGFDFYKPALQFVRREDLVNGEKAMQLSRLEGVE